MFARQLQPDESEPLQFPFTCSRCKQPSQTAFMCQACFDATDPTQKHDNQAWYEPPKSKPRAGRGQGRIEWLAEQKAKKAAKTFTELAGEFFTKETQTLAPGWTERIQEFAERESRVNERQTWLRDNATQLWAVHGWLYWLEEMDRYRISGQRWKEYGGKKPDVINLDISAVSEGDIAISEIDIPDETLDGLGLAPMSPQQLKNYSRYTVFAKKVVSLLTNEEFAILQILVHQMKVNHAAGKRIYKSTEAAKALTTHLGRMITPANYRKLVEKLYKTLEVENGLNIGLWIQAGYL